MRGPGVTKPSNRPAGRADPSSDRQARSSSDEHASPSRWKWYAAAAFGVLAVAAAYLFIPRSADPPPSTPPESWLTLSTEPSPANVVVNASFIGETPLDRLEVETRDGRAEVRISKAGFVTIDTMLTLGESHTIALLAAPVEGAPARQESETEDEPPPPISQAADNGTLAVRIQPERARIFVENRELENGSDARLPAGTHRVRLSHILYGEFEHDVRVRAGETSELRCTFEQPVNISARPVWGTVFLSGNDTGQTTPTQVDLPPGSHSVEVRKFGFASELTDGPAGPITVEGTCDPRVPIQLVFNLTESQ